jgi:Fic family protein
MPILALNHAERESLKRLYFEAEALGREYSEARKEIMAAIRCLKAVNSNAIEDASIDPVFLQILLHDAGIEDKGKVSPAYETAYRVVKGQEAMLLDLERRALEREPLSISMLLDMHRRVFGTAWLEGAGTFRLSDVSISGMRHQPPPAPHVQQLLYQRFTAINEQMTAIHSVTPETFDRILQLSAETHYLVAGVHPFEDGNGRMARALGDYVILYFGMYYDVIMSDYRDNYLDALEECNFADTTPLYRFIEYSYLETLERISTFFRLTRAGVA